MKRVRAGLLAAALAGLVVVAAARWLQPSMCANRLVSEVRSPDGMLKIVVFERDSGATTAASIQASVVAADAPLPSAGGNLFVADNDHGKAAVGMSGTPQLRVVWTSPRDVVLRHDQRARVFKALDHVDDVRASYEILP